ncbi:ATP-grasp domain-containing protein [Sodalis sp. RH22]|uniref:ATP-grasp domain-containing protein n=1 Tax=unclassified Sodalis (in: enterobacteria) TaxID=2636512 RepID=UPI0039B3E82A
MKKLLIIEKSPSGAIGLKKAKDYGCFVIFIGSDKYHNRLKDSEKKYIDEIHTVDTNDYDAVIKTVDAISKEHSIDGVFTFMEFYVELAAIVAEHLKLNGISPLSASNARNKFKMREIFKQNNISQPSFALVTTLDELNSVKKYFDYPNIIKPINMSGSRGVAKNNTPQELLNNFNELSTISPLFGVEKEDSYLIESFLVGEEFSVESVTFHGITHIVSITKKIVCDGKYFVEIGHVSPAMIPDDMYQKVIDVTSRGLEALGIDNAVSHTEVKINDSTVSIVEIAARLGGDHIPELVMKSSGVDLWHCAISISLNEKPEFFCTRNTYAGIAFITANEGIFSSFELQEINKNICIEEVHADMKPGDLVHSLTCSSDRLGYVILTGENYQEIYDYCSRPKKLYHVESVNP